MSNKERQTEKTRLGRIKPSAEVRKAENDIKKCREIFEELGLEGFLLAINEAYLGKKGEIENPLETLGTKVEESTIPKNHQDQLELLDVSPMVSTSLKWANDKDPNTIHNIHIVLSLPRFEDSHTGYVGNLQLSASTEFVDNKNLINSIWISRTIRLWPGVQNVYPQLVDDALLTFTGELIDSGILNVEHE